MKSLLALVLLTASAWSQTLYGTLVGNITDSSQASVPGAAVKIVNTGTRQEYAANANAAGAYVVNSIPAGAYDITITHTGFQTYAQQGVVINASATVRIDAALQVGAITETVKVTSSTVALQTDSADVRSAWERSSDSRRPR